MIHPWRRLAETAQAVMILGLPFLKIKGESALRFDIPSLRLHFFGISIWIEEFFIVLIALIFLTFLIVFITLLFGRIWCGWLCPQTVIVDFTHFVDKAKSKGTAYKFGAYGAIFLISILVAANLIWYFVSPYEFFIGLAAGGLGKVTWGFWVVLTGIIFLNFVLLRHKFCVTVCPYAKLQSVLFDNKTLVIAFDPRRKEECIKCRACAIKCPVGIDIRDGLSSACINCAECVDACTKMMKHRQKKSLVHYSFGWPGESGRILRQNAVLTGSVTTLFLVFFVYLLMTRIPVDMTVLPNYAFPPRIVADGGVINSYILSVINRERADVDLEITAKNGQDVKIAPDRVHVYAGELKKIPVYVTIKHIDTIELAKGIDIHIESKEVSAIKVTKKANFIIPEG